MLAANSFTHRMRVVDTEQFVLIVDENVEVCEEALAEYLPNARIGGLNLSEVLHHHERLFDYAGTCLKCVENGSGGLRITGNGNKADRALWLEMEF